MMRVSKRYRVRSFDTAPATPKGGRRECGLRLFREYWFRMRDEEEAPRSTVQDRHTVVRADEPRGTCLLHVRGLSPPDKRQQNSVCGALRKEGLFECP